MRYKYYFHHQIANVFKSVVPDQTNPLPTPHETKIMRELANSTRQLGIPTGLFEAGKNILIVPELARKLDELAEDDEIVVGRVEILRIHVQPADEN